MEYRIEQLAQAAGVAVDTIRFYQGKRLLDPPRREGRITWYGETHLERLRRIRELHQKGFTLAVIRRFLAGELETSDEALVAAVTEPPAGGGESLTLTDLSSRSGMPVAVLQALESAGLLVPTGPPDGSAAQYQESDVEVLRAGVRLLEAGIPLTDLLVLATAYSDAVEPTARTAVDLFDRHVREPLQDGAGPEVSTRLIELFDEMLAVSTQLVHHHFRRALMRAANQRIEGAASRPTRSTRRG